MIRRGILARAKAGMADLRAAARWNRPAAAHAGAALRVIVGVEAIAPGFSQTYAEILVDMETGREIIAAAGEIIERKLAQAPRRERPAHG